jgi:hypothetical protein
MPVYNVSRASSALSTTNDTLTIIASSTKPLRVIFGKVAGMGTASAANEVLLMRSSGGSGGGGAITPTPVNSGDPAASFTVNTTWSTQPTAGAVLHRFAPNANGGIDPWVAVPGAEISIPVSGQVSLRSASGTSNVVPNFTIEEVTG